PRIADERESLFQWLSLISVGFATWVMLRKVDKLPWSTVGLGRAAANPPAIVTGTLLGAFTIGLASLGLYVAHLMRFDPAKAGSWLGEAGHAVVVLLPAAFFEELFIRGYVFAVIRRMAGWRLALISTSVVFGLLHAWNPGAGAAHCAWNWVMAGALHIAVSGVPSADVDYRMVETGPDWLTGGPWGPEGGLAAVALMFVAIFYLYGRYRRQMEWNA